jgi:iron complex transport system substrate-binding protein
MPVVLLSAAPRREVTDMAGRKVTLPAQINRIATFGPVPVLNGFLFAFGEGDKIVNGLPEFARSPRYKFQTRFAPSLASKPMMQGGGREPKLEELLKASPDVAFTMDRETVDILERNGITTIFLSWRQPEDVRTLMRLMGEALNKQAAADAYVQYFDDTVKRVTSVVASVPREKRPRVLYCNLKRLTQEQLIGEWWIKTAGGISVTDDGRKTESYTFSLEQVFAWDPDVLIVASPDDIGELNHDVRFRNLKAVASHRVLVAPIGAHLWANRTVEQPLTLLWAAQVFLPGQFREVDLVKETQAFYRRFFAYPLTEAEARAILSGNP